MEHLELAVAVHPSEVEDVAELFRRFAPSGVSIEPPFDATDEEGAVDFQDDAAVRVRAWLPANEPSSLVTIERLRDALASVRRDLVGPLTLHEIEEASWADAWKEHFLVMRVGERLVLKPSWRNFDPEPEDVVVEVDPGRAFGTGQHETTRLCLVELELRLEHEATVLDVGSGSGILSAAAALLGAGRVEALDIDPAAVAATRENAGTNRVADRVSAAHGSLGARWPYDVRAAGRYDIVLANLSARILRELAVDLIDALTENGVALVSGIVADQEASCVQTLLRAGARSLERRADGDWRLLIVSR